MRHGAIDWRARQWDALFDLMLLHFCVVVAYVKVQRERSSTFLIAFTFAADGEEENEVTCKKLRAQP